MMENDWENKCKYHPIWTERCAHAHGPSMAGGACAGRGIWPRMLSRCIRASADLEALIHHGSPLIRGALIDQNTVYTCALSVAPGLTVLEIHQARFDGTAQYSSLRFSTLESLLICISGFQGVIHN
jgi:hypothetical protein